MKKQKLIYPLWYYLVMNDVGFCEWTHDFRALIATCKNKIIVMYHDNK